MCYWKPDVNIAVPSIALGDVFGQIFYFSVSILCVCHGLQSSSASEKQRVLPTREIILYHC